MLPPPLWAQAGGTCTIMRQRGPVTILREGRQHRPATGAVVQADDQIITGNNARLRLTCSGGVDATIGPDSSLSVSQVAAAGTADGALLDLIRGILRITLDPAISRSGFEVRTPTAVAAARSTMWITEAIPDRTAVFVAEGSVSVSSRQTGDSVLLQAGFGTDVALNAAPTTPVRWGQARIDSALRRTEAP